MMSRAQKRVNRAEKQMIFFSSGLLYAVSTIFFLGFGESIFFFQGEKSLFIFSQEYLQEYLEQPGGLLVYTGNLLAHMYYYPVAGSFLVSFFPVLLFFILWKIHNKLYSNHEFYVSLATLPAILLLLLQTQFEFFLHYSLGIILVLSLFSVSAGRKKRFSRILFLFLIPVIYWLTGFFAILYLGVTVIYHLFHSRGDHRYITPAACLGIAGLTYLAFKEVVYFQPPDVLLRYPAFMPGNETVPVIFRLIILYLLIFPALVFVFHNLSAKLCPAVFNNRLPNLLIICITVVILVVRYDHDQADLLKMEKLVTEQNWDAVIRLHEKSPSKELAGPYFYNLALAEKGILCDRLFFGRQDFGSVALTLPRTKEEIKKAAWFYYSVGMEGEALHLATESFILFGYRPENLRMLIKTGLIYGNYRIAERYINLLKKTIHYRGWAKKQEEMLNNPALLNSDPEPGEIIRLLPERSFFTVRNNMRNLDYLLLGNPHNKKAFEYKMAWLLLDKNLREAVFQVKKMKDMGYKSLPRHVEEAIVLFIDQNYELPYLGGFAPAPETTERYKQFMSSAHPAKDRNTFWYYYYYQ
jgi:hypothetical protein